LFALVPRRQSALAKSRPVVAGAIELSGLDEYRAAPDDSGRRGAIMYERKVAYGYSFNSVACSGVHGSFSSNSKATSPSVLRLFGMDFRMAPASRSGSIPPIRRSRRSILARHSAGCCG
jgi:hypothetical protein